MSAVEAVVARVLDICTAMTDQHAALTTVAAIAAGAALCWVGSWRGWRWLG